MKSYFSRFLHYIMSYSGLTRISRLNKFAAWFYLDTPVKPECDSVCAGRSMVEMLGVLAIIGVLSVGAIAGYSKAMMKYRLNKYAEQMNTVFNAIGRNAGNFGNIPLGERLTEIFIKMGEIPKEMIKPEDNVYIYDIFGQKWIIHISSESKYIFLQSSMSLKTKSTDNLEICRNTIITAKENAANIYYLVSISGYGTADVKNSILFGDLYCDKDHACLRNISLDDIYTICTDHIGTYDASFQITWKI